MSPHRTSFQAHLVGTWQEQLAGTPVIYCSYHRQLPRGGKRKLREPVIVNRRERNHFDQGEISESHGKNGTGRKSEGGIRKVQEQS